MKGTVPLPGCDVAIYNSSGLSYLRHTDWLGSSRFATTWNHAVYSKTSYAPFGETYNESGTADRSFTGQDQDVITGSGATGVYDFLYRKHDPSAGRWLSPDPAGWAAVNLANPQSLNRYAYALNNPLALVDPAGLCTVSQSFTLDVSANGTSQSGTTYTYTEDGGVPCTPPPFGCDYITNADGSYEGMSCIGGVSPWIPDWQPPQWPGGGGGGGGSSDVNKIAGCFVKGVVVGAATAVALGVVATVVAPAVGATAATIAIGAIAVAGATALGLTAGNDIHNHNWAGLAYDAGSVVGAFAGGLATGPQTAEAIDPNATSGWGRQSNIDQAYDPSKGSIDDWLGTGPTKAAASAANAGQGFFGSLFGGGCH